MNDERCSKAKAILTLLIILAPGLAVRIILAPYTTGSDIPQYAGFADTFLRHGLGFFSYSDGSKAIVEGWPYGWPYVYGPALIMVLGLLRLLAPGKVIHYWHGSTYYVYAPLDWIVAVKSLYILFDTLAAILIYFFMRRRGFGFKTSIVGVILYYYNPMTIYISSIYGMFDQIPFTLFLAGLILYLHGKKTVKSLHLSYFLLGLSVAFKPTMLYPLSIILLDMFIRYKWRKGITSILLTLFWAAFLFIPFALYDPEGIGVFLKAVKQVTTPDYTSPIVYTFNGFTAIAFYAYEHGGFDFKQVTYSWTIHFTILFLMVLIGYFVSRETAKYASLAYITYTATYWRVNFQYLVPTTGFSIILAASGRNKGITAAAVLLTLIIGFWPMMFPVSWWAHAHIMHPNKWIIDFLDSCSLMIFEEVYYVYYAVILTFTQITLILVSAALDYPRIPWAIKHVGKLTRIFQKAKINTL